MTDDQLDNETENAAEGGEGLIVDPAEASAEAAQAQSLIADLLATRDHSGSTDIPTTSDFEHLHLRGMFRSWFLEYASYVNLDRAIPALEDGLKPVQRRILHAMKNLDDGRFIKVANIVGNTMQYHPHGDASIGDALVQLGQKEMLIDTQGNWGNILTGAPAAAPRYIEARLSPMAIQMLYSPKVTTWTPTYDGRSHEPVTLPVKFPLLLAQGTEGIGVGMNSVILPHNFNEICDAAIAYLRHERFTLYPDFITGGLIDVSKYNDGERGGSVKIRAKIEKLDNKTLAITEIPFGTTTRQIIDSIISANDNGKIKIRQAVDLTSEGANIRIDLQPGTSSDKAIDALYAFTKCEVHVAPNCCVIDRKQPIFVTVSDVLRHTTERTRQILLRELQIRLDEVRELLLAASLERIFIENRIYKDREYENAKTTEAALKHVTRRLKPLVVDFYRQVTPDDIAKLLEIKMKRIIRYNVEAADRLIQSYNDTIAELTDKIEHITDYTIAWFADLKERYGAAYPRKTQLRSFDQIEASTVAEATEKLYWDRDEGFIGMGLKGAELVCQCSPLDDVIVFYKDGRYKVVRVSDKMFIGKDVLHLSLFRRGDDRTIYNVIYRDGRAGNTYMKRFAVTGVTRDKEYNLTKGTAGSRVLWFTRNTNGEAETVKVVLKPKARLNKLQFDVDFSQLAIKGKSTGGNLVTKNEVLHVKLKEQGASTLGGRKVWFDHDVLRLNYDGRGEYLGEFYGHDRILVVTKDGRYYTSTFDAGNHYEPGILRIEKFRPGHVFTAIVDDADQGYPYLKRFAFEPTAKLVSFIGDNPKSRLIDLTAEPGARYRLTFGGGDAHRLPLDVDAIEFIAVKSLKARGKRLTTFAVDTFAPIDPRPADDPEVKQLLGLEAEANSAEADDEPAEAEPELTDEQLRDALIGQKRLFDD